jgi:hypothetical protein
MGLLTIAPSYGSIKETPAACAMPDTTSMPEHAAPTHRLLFSIVFLLVIRDSTGAARPASQIARTRVALH